MLDGNLSADFLTLRLRWFDRWLKRISNGVDREPTVRLFVMGGGSGRKNAAGRMHHGGEPPDPDRAGSTRVATNLVYMDVSRPSHVILPVIPSRR